MNLTYAPKIMRIDGQAVELTGRDLEGLTTAQSDLYRLLSLLSTLGVYRVASLTLAHYLELQSPAPLWVRLRNLQKAGKLRCYEAQPA